MRCGCLLTAKIQVIEAVCDLKAAHYALFQYADMFIAVQLIMLIKNNLSTDWGVPGRFKSLQGGVGKSCTNVVPKGTNGADRKQKCHT